MMDKSDHIYVTGGTGFLGSYILRTLVHRGYQHVHAIKRPESRMGLVRDVAEDIHWLPGDLFDYEQLVNQLQGKHVIIHSAAMISFRNKDLKEMHKVNVEATELLLEAAKEAGVKHFLYVSSVAALGRHVDHPLISEDTVFQNTKLDTGYGLTKHLGEMAVFRAMEEGIHGYIINPAMIMGSGYWDTGTARLIDTVYRRLPYYPLGTSGFVDVRDVADMSIQLLEDQLHGQRMICCAESMKIRHMIEMICRCLDRHPPTIPLTKWRRGVAWRAEGIRAWITRSNPQITRETISTSAQDFEFDQRKSIDSLNFNYRPIESCIADTCAQFLAARKSNQDYDFLPLNGGFSNF